MYIFSQISSGQARWTENAEEKESELKHGRILNDGVVRKSLLLRTSIFFHFLECGVDTNTFRSPM